MRSITLVSAAAIVAIALLVFIPSSLGEDKKCPKGKSECTKDTACVFVKKNSPVCKPLAKEGEDCNARKGNKKGQFLKYPPCEASLVCKPGPKNKKKILGKCEKK